MSDSNQRLNRCPFMAFAPCASECTLLVSYAEWSNEKKRMERRKGCALAVSGKPVNYYVSEDDDG